MDKVDLKGMLPEELESLVSSFGKERYRSKQLIAWIYRRGINDFGAMTDLSKRFREELDCSARVSSLGVEKTVSSPGGDTLKFLFKLEDGMKVEAVLIYDDSRSTVCLSSQVGCPLSCRFCATGAMGFSRNLKAAEMVGQLLQIRDAATDNRVTNVVFMGMGEPLLNYEELIRAIKLIKLEGGISLGTRKITISTAGIIPGIERLSHERLGVGLAISLNATTDRVRDRIMPINRKYPLGELLRSLHRFCRASRRRVTFEYVLIKGLNDSDADARRLADIALSFPAKINLIPFNPVSGSKFERPSNERVLRFQEIIWGRNLTAIIRESKGDNIAAACGQLYTENRS